MDSSSSPLKGSGPLHLHPAARTVSRCAAGCGGNCRDAKPVCLCAASGSLIPLPGSSPPPYKSKPRLFNTAFILDSHSA